MLTKNAEMKTPTVARVMMGQSSFLSLSASMWMAPANSRKLSIIFISTCSKLMCLAMRSASAEKTGIRLPRKTTSNEKNNDKAIMPMVGGHLMSLSFTYANTAASSTITDMTW